MTNNVLNFWRNSSDDPFDLLFDHAPIMMHSIDDKGVLLKVSKFWAAKLGYDVDEMIGKPSVDFLTPASRDYAVNDVLPRFVKSGKAESVEYDFVRKDGGIMSVRMSALAQHDDEGNFVRSLAVIFDNTDAKRAASMLNQNQRLEAIGRLVGGVAHDFNNILTLIQGNIEFLRDDMDHPDRESYLNDAFRATRRGASLTQQLLAYSRRAHLQPKRTDLNRVIGDMDSMIRRLLPSNIEIETVAAGGLWRSRVDRHQLDTALLNIINNARDAMANGGKITIETANIRITEEYVAERGEDIDPGHYVMLAVSDTGTGMDDETADQIFEPFFTTKPVGMGTGLGLSMVYGFVKQSGGAIRVYSELGYGSTFKLYFPAEKSDVSDNYLKAEDHEVEVNLSPLAEVLVVEDEDDVRKLIVAQLRDRGIRVSQASSGDIAETMLSTGYRPRVIVTDLVMPGKLQGVDLAVKAREMIKDIDIIFLSGYPQEAAIHGNGLNVADLQFVKPVDRTKLSKAVLKFLKEDEQ